MSNDWGYSDGSCACVSCGEYLQCGEKDGVCTVCDDNQKDMEEKRVKPMNNRTTDKQE